MNNLALLTALMFGSTIGGIEIKSRPTPEEKPCLNCGKLKQHNNHYCSADCCREYKEKTKK